MPFFFRAPALIPLKPPMINVQYIENTASVLNVNLSKFFSRWIICVTVQYLYILHVYIYQFSCKMVQLQHMLPLEFKNIQYHDGWPPELSCCSRRCRTSPRGKGVDKRNMSQDPLSSTGLSGSVRWWMLLSASEPTSFAVTCRTAQTNKILKANISNHQGVCRQKVLIALHMQNIQLIGTFAQKHILILKTKENNKIHTEFNTLQ